MENQHPSPHNVVTSYAVPLYDTTAFTAALANPYARHYASSHMSPHYYQAYLQAYPPRTTADGYTLSSTYVPGTVNRTSKAALTMPTPRQPPVQTRSHTTAKPISNHLTHGSWYQPGNCRCSRQGCPFSGSRKSVEIHMMDRHFIFPPGWVKKSDWDADPSLRGKPIAIHGTSLMLETPEAIDAWRAERKRRFPTEANIQDKKRKLEEAVARGQLTPEGIGASARKKHRRNATFTEGDNKGVRGQGHQRGRGCRREGLVQRPGYRIENADNATSGRGDAKTSYTQEESPDSRLTSDNDEAPEVVSSKVPATPLYMPKHDVRHNSEAQTSRIQPQESVKRVSQPRKLPRNPFASRSTLLRNVLGVCYPLTLIILMVILIKLLLPEIRMTVSNLSQAIHFLVENDFLRGVELQPGEAQGQMIEVLGNSETPRPVPSLPREPSNGM